MSSMNEKDYVLIKKDDHQACGIFCQVCDFLIKTADDSRIFNEWGTCHDCYLRFVESRREEWKDGWRPEQEILDKLYSEKSRIFIK